MPASGLPSTGGSDGPQSRLRSISIGFERLWKLAYCSTTALLPVGTSHGRWPTMQPCSIASGKINHSRKWHNCLSGGRRRYASESRSLLEKPNGFFRKTPERRTWRHRAGSRQPGIMDRPSPLRDRVAAALRGTCDDCAWLRSRGAGAFLAGRGHQTGDAARPPTKFPTKTGPELFR